MDNLPINYLDSKLLEIISSYRQALNYHREKVAFHYNQAELAQQRISNLESTLGIIKSDRVFLPQLPPADTPSPNHLSVVENNNTEQFLSPEREKLIKERIIKTFQKEPRGLFTFSYLALTLDLAISEVIFVLQKYEHKIWRRDCINKECWQLNSGKEEKEQALSKEKPPTYLERMPATSQIDFSQPLAKSIQDLLQKVSPTPLDTKGIINKFYTQYQQKQWDRHTYKAVRNAISCVLSQYCKHGYWVRVRTGFYAIRKTRKAAS